ncbi:unnamed protein product [Parascedosporium putredinis]|uniref:Uncharacterized protein n=1 Tax=Parascedosporium putredinis TaxID=1442378 RepID=A0A9P1H006_9PEZI|nr:unnamed protein product [Parascedosporium putredinis]CAI7992340.1 unnamed protein product [Parascedosporium putredinis]
MLDNVKRKLKKVFKDGGHGPYDRRTPWNEGGLRNSTHGAPGVITDLDGAPEPLCRCRRRAALRNDHVADQPFVEQTALGPSQGQRRPTSQVPSDAQDLVAGHDQPLTTAQAQGTHQASTGRAMDTERPMQSAVLGEPQEPEVARVPTLEEMPYRPAPQNLHQSAESAAQQQQQQDLNTPAVVVTDAEGERVSVESGPKPLQPADLGTGSSPAPVSDLRYVSPADMQATALQETHATRDEQRILDHEASERHREFPLSGARTTPKASRGPFDEHVWEAADEDSKHRVDERPAQDSYEDILPPRVYDDQTPDPLDNSTPYTFADTTRLPVNPIQQPNQDVRTDEVPAIHTHDAYGDEEDHEGGDLDDSFYTVRSQPGAVAGGVSGGDSVQHHVEYTTETRDPVTHEVIKPEVHTIYEPRRTRSIHFHEVKTVYQPIIDPEPTVLPEQHWIQDDTGKMYKISEELGKKLMVDAS